MEIKFLFSFSCLAILYTISFCKLQNVKTKRRCFQTNMIETGFKLERNTVVKIRNTVSFQVISKRSATKRSDRKLF